MDERETPPDPETEAKSASSDAPEPEPSMPPTLIVDSSNDASAEMDQARAPTAAQSPELIEMQSLSPRRPDSPFFLHLLLFPTLALLSLLLSPVADRISKALRFPYQIDAEEGFVFQQAIDLHEGRSIYTPIEEEPYLVGNYPPLFPWAISRLITPSRIGLPLGRALAVLTSAALAMLLLLIVYWRTRRMLPAFLAPLLFVVTYEFYTWSAFCRVDLPALMLTALGLFIYVAIRPRWGASLAAVVFVLAAFTRQTAILAPAACCLAMLLGDRRRLVWFLAPYLGLGLVGFLYLDSRTGGQFYLHLVRYNQNAMNWRALRMLMRNEIWFFHRWFILAAAAGAIGAAAVRCSRPAVDEAAPGSAHDCPHARYLFGIYAVLATASLVTFAKVGSAQNYALEPLAAWALFGMITLGRMFDDAGGADSPRRLCARLTVAVMGALLLVHAVRFSPLRRPGADPRPNMYDFLIGSPNPGLEDYTTGRKVLAAVRAARGDILTEYPIFSILAGRNVFYEPFIMSRLAAEGLWDPEIIQADIRRQRFGLIVTSQNLHDVERDKPILRFTPAMARTVLGHYQLEYKLDSPHPQRGLGQAYYLWLPIDESERSKSELDDIAWVGLKDSTLARTKRERILMRAMEPYG